MRAPHWNDRGTGTISGPTLGTTQVQIARAMFKAIALQIADVCAAMEQDIGAERAALLADGDPSAHRLLMQLQADVLKCPVARSNWTEGGTLGAAAMAVQGLGVAADTWESAEPPEVFTPCAGDRSALRDGWARAIAGVRAQS